MPQGQLSQVLGGAFDRTDERLLVGSESVDDAGVVALAGAGGLPADARTALVQTVDFFPPVVEDPYYYGAIAAANSLSDVYAMGGRPFCVLNLAGFPKEFPEEWIREIFRGGYDKVREAGALVAGGHTVQTAEVQFGYSVTGLVDRERVTANTGAQVGDVLYLTKAIGMGAMTTAAKKGRISWEQLLPAAVQMATLNAAAGEAMEAAGAHACTDITGFGLVGHAHNVAKASKVTLRFDMSEVPVHPGARELGVSGCFSGGVKRGKASLGESVAIGSDLDPTLVSLAFDAETSGGLLIALAPEQAAVLERELAARDQIVRRVGECIAATDAWVELA